VSDRQEKQEALIIDLESLANDQLIHLRARLEVEMKQRGVAFSIGEISEALVIEHFRHTPGLPNLLRAPAGTKTSTLSPATVIDTQSKLCGRRGRPERSTLTRRTEKSNFLSTLYWLNWEMTWLSRLCTSLTGTNSSQYAAGTNECQHGM